MLRNDIFHRDTFSSFVPMLNDLSVLYKRSARWLCEHLVKTKKAKQNEKIRTDFIILFISTNRANPDLKAITLESN